VAGPAGFTREGMARRNIVVLRFRPQGSCGQSGCEQSSGSHATRRWREMDSNFRFRAFLSLRSSSVFSIPRSRSAEGTDAESGTEAISLKRKESGGLPIAFGCTRSKTWSRSLFTHLLGGAM
jgi:hypothetical protein